MDAARPPGRHLLPRALGLSLALVATRVPTLENGQVGWIQPEREVCGSVLIWEYPHQPSPSPRSKRQRSSRWMRWFSVSDT